jgi:hypothetical protein
MARDEWFNYNGKELVNLSRTAQLAEALNISTLWVQQSAVQWVEDALGGSGYNDIAQAPWYDAGYAASTEFAGIVPLEVRGLDDSTLESTPVEYITDGGHSGKPRNTTLSIVWNVAIIASTDRGAEYGKRWLDRRLRDSGSNVFCSGADLDYFRAMDGTPEKVHRRDVRLTRGTSVTRKRRNECSSVWLVTFTMTAADPYEYGQAISFITALGGTTATGPKVASQGGSDLTQIDCPVFDYTPVYDPLYPALVPSPTAPDFLPDGWTIATGQGFRRKYAVLNVAEPSDLLVVPLVKLHSTTEARMLRVAVWKNSDGATDQCDPLWAVVVSYLPPDVDFYIDGEEHAAYLWDGASPNVRRTDSLIYSPNAEPVEWTAFNDPTGLIVTLDTFAKTGGYEGDGNVRLSLSLTAKSD